MADVELLAFARSSFCANSGCVEVAFDKDTVFVRDSKVDEGPMLAYTHAEWSAFTAGVKAGEFDTTTA